MTPRNWALTALLCGLALASSTPVTAQPRELTPRQKQLLNSIKWQQGPCDAKVGSVATIKVPAGYHFVDASGTQAYLELNGDPPDANTLGILEPVRDSTWAIHFCYEDIGYVKDDEKDKIDANALIDALKKGSVEANKKRAQMGSPPLDLVGWETPPFYDSATNRLTWAMRYQSQGQFIVNYNSKLLGRSGVMSATLVVSPEELQATVPTYQKLLQEFSFVPGKRYSEFREGDRVSEYGLAALVAGGAFAVAAKSGLLAKLIKPLIIGLAVVGGLIAKFWAKLFGKKDASA